MKRYHEPLVIFLTGIKQKSYICPYRLPLPVGWSWATKISKHFNFHEYLSRQEMIYGPKVSPKWPTSDETETRCRKNRTIIFFSSLTTGVRIISAPCQKCLPPVIRLEWKVEKRRPANLAPAEKRGT
jgi:hypothetical protein